MTYRRAVIPALIGGLLLAALLWWAGASAEALHLPGSGGTLGPEAVAELQRWLTPWSYDPPAFLDSGAQVSGYVGDTTGGDNRDHYGGLYTTALQIRYGAVLVIFVLGALLLLRRLPPVRGRTTAAFLALWAWGAVAGTLAVTLSAPWLIASTGHGSYRFLPQLANVIAGGRQLPVAVGLVAAGATVLVARITGEGAGPLPRTDVPARAARLAATAGTAVIALSVVVLSYQSVAAALQTYSPDGGFLAEPGDLLRQWLLLGAWAARRAARSATGSSTAPPTSSSSPSSGGPCAASPDSSPGPRSRPWRPARSAPPSSVSSRASSCGSWSSRRAPKQASCTPPPASATASRPP